ncbi:hypothetical protein D3C81_2037930 [compost metagenome]
MNVTGFPFSEEMTNSQIKLQEGLSDVLAGQGHLKVRVEPASPPETDEKAPT